MPTPAMNAWVKTALGTDVEGLMPAGGTSPTAGQQVAADGGGQAAAPAPGPARQGPAQNADATPVFDVAIDEKGLVFIPDADVKQLKTDVAGTRVLVDKALLAEGDMYGVAATSKVNLDQPQAAVATLKASVPPLSKQDKAVLELSLEQIESQRLVLQNLFHQMEAAKEALGAAIDMQKKLPPEIKDPDSAKKWETAGETMEHAWDFINQVTSVLDHGVGDAIHAVLGTDLVKDNVKKITDQIAEVEEQVENSAATINSVIATLKGASAKAAKDAELQLQRGADDYRQALHAYANELETYAKLLASAVEKAKAGSGKPKDASADAKRVISAYQAILDAAGASQRARSASSRTRSRPRNTKTG